MGLRSFLHPCFQLHLLLLNIKNDGQSEGLRNLDKISQVMNATIHIIIYDIYYLYIYVCVWCIRQYRSLCFTADEYSLGIKAGGLHFQSCYFVKGPMNSLDLCQFRCCLPPVSVRSSQLFPLSCTLLFRWPFWSQEKCRWKALGSSRGPACQIEERNWWLARGGSPVDRNVTNYLFQQVDLLNQSPWMWIVWLWVWAALSCYCFCISWIGALTFNKHSPSMWQVMRDVNSSEFWRGPS